MAASLTYGSTFTGVGGFDLGFDRAGMRCAWQAEQDRDCNRILARHWPDTQRGTDVCSVTRDSYARVDVLCGGFPCQDVSVAGLRAGLAGARSGLWHEFHRLARELTPRICVIENVPGLLSSNDGHDFLTILRGLEELGYCVAWTVLDSQYRGLAQRRERVFIVASLGDGRCAEILFEPESVRGDSPPSRETGQSIAGTIGGSSQSGGFRTTDLDNSGAFIVANRMTAFGEYVDDDTASTCKQRDYKDATDLIAFSCKVRRLTPLEYERLQGFPDYWTLLDAAGRTLSDSTRYKMLGNAVTVPVAEWLGQRIVTSLCQP